MNTVHQQPICEAGETKVIRLSLIQLSCTDQMAIAAE